MINGERSWLWRAVDDAGDVLDILVQRGRSALAAKRFFHKLLKGLRMVPCAIVTDRLASYAAAKAVVMPTVLHLRGCRQNNPVCNHVRPGRHALSAPNYHTVMRLRWRGWDVVSETTACAVAA